MKKASRIASAVLALASMAGFHTTSVATQATSIQQAQSQSKAVAIGLKQNTRSIRADMAGDFASGILHALRDNGLTPKEFNMSRACRNMVRQSRMRRCGMGGQRI